MSHKNRLMVKKDVIKGLNHLLDGVDGNIFLIPSFDSDAN